MERTDREPCPFRIVDDAGGAFLFGLVGGTVWHTIGGARNAPKGHRISEAVSRAKARVPMLGGSFAVWGVLFSCCDCTFTYFRKKEDAWNAIISGAATGGILAARAGIKAAGRSALAGGAILAAIEGLNIVLMRVLMPLLEKQQAEAGVEIDRLIPPNDPSRPRVRRVQNKPLWEENASPSPLFTNNNNSNPFANNNPFATTFPPSTDSSSSSTGQWDTPGFRTENTNSSENTQDNANKSSWKFW